MADQPRNRGPWTHRALVWVFGVALGFLIYWLLGFVVNDIATWPGPKYETVEQELLDPALRREEQEIARAQEQTQAEVAQREIKQNLLRDSTNSSQQTTLQGRQKLLAEKLQAERQPIREEFERRWQWHQYKLALAKLAFLLPLSAIAGWLFLRGRRSIYAPLIYAFGIALAVKVTMVMHDHFPARYFKYLMIVVAIAIVLRVLVYLLRMIARPSTDYLLRQYREAYERFFCPICDYPIRRGPLKYVFWSRRTIKKLHFPPQSGEGAAADEPYTCPACATPLFEKCDACGGIRHSLLPACDHCGKEKAQAVVGK